MAMESTTSGLPYYRADPTSTPRGAVVVIHEIWGLNGQIKSVADRLAAEGYAAVAPDLFSSVGLTPEVGAELERLMHGTEEERHRAQPLLREKTTPIRSPEFAEQALAHLSSLVDDLAGTTVTVTGFCFGGTYAFALAAADRRIAAAAPFYGSAPEDADLAAIAGPVLAFYGADDERITGALPDVERAMRRSGVDFEAVVYENTGHAFFNDTNPSAFRAGPAADAWSRLLDFFGRATAQD
ncbi:dienelactone hydrolase family protein [Tsukamurella sp. 8F]|uniref:dienelactone hydrolase family protein n=1 Tax=unclassified Tsukamurella TaxID=2633480 RepID=UPI0023B9AA90|nr:MULTISPECIES: dienelactone hydrolase family protein [unclassified Tsukamurella]MDF0531328.1 dienelactone hydrolase family protein [Tsukamurella sp. 8J]MDF0588534.1 dienelactone hydrolase family protein [Tsukamurella sp. 8F]